MRATAMAGVIVLVIIGIGFVAILFPALGAAREDSRRTQCGNNIKQLCMSLQNYHDALLYLPYGAQNSPVDKEKGNISWGKSWFVALLPHLEGRTESGQLEKAQKASASHCFTSSEVRGIVDGKAFKGFFCPSSPLPEWQTLTGSRLVVPSYAGIMGATDEPPLLGRSVVPPKPRVVAAPYGGQAAGNGMLLINQSFTFAACTDGTANTIIVGEVSDWYYDDAKQKRNPALSIGDAGDGALDEAGWLAGNNLGYRKNFRDQAEHVYEGGPAIPDNSVCNLITIDHPIGTNNLRGVADSAPNWGKKGIGRCGFNNPLLSAHAGGAMVGYVDGHVVLMATETSLDILKKLANRDDREGR
jgi:prepilin-type processing-associated H-X9-DG protein